MPTCCETGRSCITVEFQDGCQIELTKLGCCVRQGNKHIGKSYQGLHRTTPASLTPTAATRVSVVQQTKVKLNLARPYLVCRVLPCILTAFSATRSNLYPVHLAPSKTTTVLLVSVPTSNLDAGHCPLGMLSHPLQQDSPVSCKAGNPVLKHVDIISIA